MIPRILKQANMLFDNLRYAIGTGKPRLIGKLVRNHLRVRMGKMIPRSLCIAVDYKCNLSCDHCSAVSLHSGDKPSMTMDQYRELARQAEQLGFFNIQFTGGEPLLRKDLEEIISVFHPRKNFIMVSTNATLLTETRIKSLQRAGVDVLSVSLDSSDDTVHDAFRGQKGAWQKTVNAVKLARKMGMKVSLSAVITHQNIRSDDLESLATLTKSLGCGMQLGWACPVGAWAGNREAQLNEDDMQYLSQFMERHRHTRTDFEGNYKERGCPAVKEMMYITAQGEFMPCAFIPISYGNVTDEPLNEIRDRALSDPIYQKYWDRCLSACNDEFYEKYLTPTYGQPTPLPYKQLHQTNTNPLRVLSESSKSVCEVSGAPSAATVKGLQTDSVHRENIAE